jgi:hypothetical protein
MVGYEPWDGGYLVLEPKLGKVHRACDLIFHEASLGPIILVLIPDAREQAASGKQDETPSQPLAPIAQTGNERLTIRISMRPWPTAAAGAADTDTLMSSIPDYPAHTT